MNRIIKSLVLAAVAVMVAGSADAAIHQVNIFGASAQFKFFQGTMTDFLADELGCATGDIYSYYSDDEIELTAGGTTGKRDTAIAVCLGDTPVGTLTSTSAGVPSAVSITVDGSSRTVPAGSTVVVTVTSFASFEGPRSVLGIDPDGNGATDGCTATDRAIIDPASVPVGDWGTGVIAAPKFSDGGVGNTAATMVCADIHLGTADVKSETFSQTSSGYRNGPCGGADQFRSVVGETVPGSANYLNYEPFAVPFAFFLNNRVGSGKQIPFNNISRAMAINIYSGLVTNWNQFRPDLDLDGTAGEAGDLDWTDTNGNGQLDAGEAAAGSGDSLPIIACLRHAGSGTAATLDAAVMKGAALVSAQNPSVTNVLISQLPYVYFNNGSSEMIDCVSGDCSGAYGAGDSNAPTDAFGAIGYADADKVGGVTGQPIGDAGFEIKRAFYNGVDATRVTIANGQYSFWGANQVYQAKADTNEELALGALLMETYAGDATNLPSSKAAYWASQSELTFPKANDFADPIKN